MTLFERVFGGNDYNYERTVAAVNEAIAAALADGSMDDFVVQANEQASGEIIEGLVD